MKKLNFENLVNGNIFEEVFFFNSFYHFERAALNIKKKEI